MLAALLLAAAVPHAAAKEQVEPGETVLDLVVERLGAMSTSFETRGLLAVTVIRFDTADSASFRGAEQFKSASVVKALWVAAALAHSGVEATEPVSVPALYGSSNSAAGRAMDLAGGIDEVNGYAHGLGLADTTAYEWEFDRDRRSVSYPGPMRGLNLTTTDDLAGFWAMVGYGWALGLEERAALLQWTVGPKASGEGSRLIARLPETVGAMTSFKMGWLPTGREYELKEDEVGWNGEPGGTTVIFDAGAVSAGAGIVRIPGGASYAIAVAAYDGRDWSRMTSWVEYVSCIVYSVLAEDPIDCVRSRDPSGIVERRAVPTGELEAVRSRHGLLTASGWAVDPDAWWRPSPVAITVDGVRIAAAGAFPTGVDDLFAPEFSRTVAFEAEPGFHEVCAVALNDGVGEDTPIGCRLVSF